MLARHYIYRRACVYIYGRARQYHYIVARQYMIVVARHYICARVLITRGKKALCDGSYGGKSRSAAKVIVEISVINCVLTPHSAPRCSPSIVALFVPLCSSICSSLAPVSDGSSAGWRIHGLLLRSLLGEESQLQCCSLSSRRATESH